MKTIPGILIQGDGVAAWCSALLLRRAGFQVGLRAAPRPKVPAIMLSDASVALIRDVFENQDLFRTAPRIVKRVVAWGPGNAPASFDHSAVVVSEEQLQEALEERHAGDPKCTADWKILASRPLPAMATESRFGNRSATATPVQLKAEAEPMACWMESTEHGWLFLITNAPGAGWLLAVGAPAHELIAQSRLAAPQVAHYGAEAISFPCAPRIVSPLCGPEWLACGSAAMAFDPICGDGTAHAVREAILAAAVIGALEDRGDAASLLAHYEARLTAGFRKHLEMCSAFYRSGGNGEWWRNQTVALQRGIAWCDEKLGPNPAFLYRLSGFELLRA